jgi:hypothetical protein
MSQIHNISWYVLEHGGVMGLWKKINLEFLTYVQGENTGVEKVKNS